MSQNMHPPGHQEDQVGASQDSGPAYSGANPYYAQHSAASVPDLDANTPLLKSSDVQKLNRKALVFLAGIVALLVVAAIWMFNSAGAEEETKPKVAEEEILIPEAPKAAAAEPLPPLPVADAAEMPPLPMAPPMQPMPLPDAGGQPLSAQEPSLLSRRMGASEQDEQRSGTAVMPGMITPDSYAQAMLGMQGQGQAQPARPGVASAQPILNPDTLLVRGTYLRCVMETRIITDVPGFTSCVVTEPVYSINGRRLLLPKGSKISGTYKSDNVTGPRVAVVWDRITTPNGIDINMASPGVDNLGAAGHPGDYDAHWGSRIASALLISMISDAFKYAGAKHGPSGSTVTNSGNEIIQPYESNTARAMERLAGQALERGASRPPTVTINQGTVVNVYVAKDVDFSSVLR
ncbi:TrbI/VirB10 family protein [Lysobacter solisilvae (ex Woo and Kim 2020)]|uniref:TrbI/VirB10 family protein n=1 Tax=Agrilutibacter terrestris TaxID=2865112 RepID=A0A7H0FXW3_9GAMM|nr:TrbI/VirB10 family protein [Lysobacter terrestris]QNP40879.1 TrbI/VirB10 family protein [Lysobacter terrestris]